MAKSLKEMGWRQPVGVKKPIKAIFNGDVGILNVNGKEYSVRNWSDEDFEDFCGEFGAPAIHPGKNGNEWVATLTKDPTAELDKALKVVESKKRPATKRVVRENDELIDAAANPEAAPAPQPVPVPAQQAPAAPEAAPPVSQPGPMNPLVPPQPGMIPTGWMYPNQSAQAVAMETGDASLAAAAPGGGVVGGEPVTNEEAEMVQEYRKYKRAKRLESLASNIAARVKEASEDELEPEMPENPDLTMPPEAGEEGEGFEDEAAVEDVEGEEGADIDMDELEDVVIDINKLFADAGGDLAAVTSPEALAGEEAEEEFEGEPEADEDVDGQEAEPEEAVRESRKKKENKLVDMLPEADADLGPEAFAGDVEGLYVEDASFDDDDLDSGLYDASTGGVPADDEFTEDEIPDELDPGNAIQDYGFDESRKTKKRTWREAALPQNAVDIKFPAGTPAPKVSGDAIDAAYATPTGSAIQAYEARAKARRAVLEELRRRNSRKAEGLADGDLGDADKSVDKVVDEIIPGSNKSAILDEARKPGPSSKFLENYKEKQKLDYRKMLEQGLLG